MLGKYIQIIFIISLYLLMVKAENIPSYDDITVLEKDERHLIFRWEMADLRFEEVQLDDGSALLPRMKGGIIDAAPGTPELPFRLITLGAPDFSPLNIQVIKRETETRSSIRIAPIPYVYKDKSGVSAYKFLVDPDTYYLSDSLQINEIYLQQPERIRDLIVQRLRINPLRYNPHAKELTIIKSLTVRIEYPPSAMRTAAKPLARDRFEAIYPRIILNYDQAKNWKSIPAIKLAKQAALPAGNIYKIMISENGIYKITPGILQSAGISSNSIIISAIQMFNNGGRALSQKVYDTWYNPAFTKEIPVFIQDVNSNGVFDGNDYLLFYGKHSSGWFFNPASGNMDYHQHPYANNNQYLLSVDGINGLRMQEDLSSDLESVNELDYFVNRFHFEEDKYNILASGPDWYGHRFFGLSADYSKNFSLDFDEAAELDPYFKIRFKGGSGSHWGDKNSYHYYFSVLLNNRLLIDEYSFSDHSLVTWSKSLTSPGVIKNGSNTLNIQYTANRYEQSNAYLDWFEIYYPGSLSAADNYLSFYAGTATTPTGYQLSGFSSVNDIYIMDVTDVTQPKIIKKDLSGGQLIRLDYDQITSEKHLIAFSLSSSKIKSAPKPIKIESYQNLLDTNNKADFLIITHPSFFPYAQEIAELRSPEFDTKVMSTADVYLNFNNGVHDPTAIRNFIRYAYYNWQKPAPSYVLLFGDGHYDYRNIQISDSMRVPPFEIYDAQEVNSRTTDNYYVDLEYNSDLAFRYISPDLAIGRILVRNLRDAENYVRKLKDYQYNPSRDGWQTVITFVGDDQFTTSSSNEVIHQNQAESMARMWQLAKFNKEKVYLSTFPTAPGGFGFVRPLANEALIDQINQGTLIVNYIGHGSPTQWAHEEVLVMTRDLERFNNEGKLPFMIAATCDFGKYDDPHEPSFTEKLIWKENSGVIGVLAATRLVYSHDNARFNQDFYKNLFYNGKPSTHLGEAWLASVISGINDQKYHLFADPAMYLNDPRGNIQINSISPDTLKALSAVNIQAEVQQDGQKLESFSGGAFLIVNDASYDSVVTGEYFDLVTLPGPFIFKGEVSVNNGLLEGNFIVPKSIRYKNKPSGRATLFSWNDQGDHTAMGYVNDLLFLGSISKNDSEGPEIDIYFKDYENFSSGDFIQQSPVLIARLEDESGINITGEVGHIISIQIDNTPLKDISGFFSYDRDSYTNGALQFPMEKLSAGDHVLKITAYDNLNNPSESEVLFKISDNLGIDLFDVVNYPNPFKGSTKFTFQTNRDAADITIRIYTLTGRMIQELYGASQKGFNAEIEWDGRDRDGDEIANGVYLYKLILDDGKEKKEQLEKLVILK